MKYLLAFSLLSLNSFGAALAATTDRVVGQAVPEISKHTVWNGFFALAVVLGLFFACVWGLRKMNMGGSINTAKMQIIGGITLGLREKIVLLQVGTKQLVLGVTPGRIETLAVLEGDDCLVNALNLPPSEIDASFAQKLMQALKNRADG